MKKSLLTGEILLLAFLSVLLYFSLKDDTSGEAAEVPQAPVENGFVYRFDSNGLLEEADSEEHSTSPYWWLDSGGLFTIGSGLGHTVARSLEEGSEWQRLYERNNPTDTDNGYRPQNIFRLITRSSWNDFTQEVYFRISAYNESSSPNRNESNGILLLSRYRDADNLYYAGVRVDGHSVIKKKSGDTYYTLAEQEYFPGEYNRETNSNLLPIEQWIGLRTRIATLPNNAVRIELFADVGYTGTWVKILEATDSGEHSPVIEGPAHAGIRTDFMDVSFENYRITET